MSTSGSVTLTSSSADALVKLLGMCGSTFAAEAGTAAQKADALIRTLGLTWHDVITAPKQVSAAPHKPQQTNGTVKWRAMRAYCAQHPHLLRPREKEFLDDITEWQGELTKKQGNWLEDIFQRVRREA